ncbi:MAG TPA: GTP pyrophosphokinase family protein [Candidatus Borkfalkia stercoripullorum]|nr:GTP pyrophosphokinase family protein [Candidatus Borkfalkia stercoripullorum]
MNESEHELIGDFLGGEGSTFEKVNRFMELMTRYDCAIREVRTKFEVLNEELSYKAGRNPIESITSRVKKPVSIVGKLKRLGKPITIEAISEYLNDVAGIRVICPFIDDIYKVAEMLAVQDDITVVQVKDYIRKPKPNGYRSYHMIVEIPVFFSEGKRMMRVEIQLRTVAMDFWASLEHQMKYKKESADRPEIAAELKSCAETIAATDARMLGIRKRIESLEKQTEDEKEDAMPAGVRQFW